MSNIDPSQDEGEPQISIADYRAAMNARAALEKEKTELQNQILLKDVEHAAQVAGIPTGTGAGKAFIASYEGPRDPESIHAAAVEYGIFLPEGASPGGTPAAQAQVEADRAALQASGAAPAVDEQPPAEHPGKAGLREFDARMAAGERREDAASSVVNRLTDAAIKGDPQVLVPAPERR